MGGFEGGEKKRSRGVISGWLDGVGKEYHERPEESR